MYVQCIKISSVQFYRPCILFRTTTAIHWNDNCNWWFIKELYSHNYFYVHIWSKIIRWLLNFNLLLLTADTWSHIHYWRIWEPMMGKASSKFGSQGNGKATVINKTYIIIDEEVCFFIYLFFQRYLFLTVLNLKFSWLTLSLTLSFDNFAGEIVLWSTLRESYLIAEINWKIAHQHHTIKPLQMLILIAAQSTEMKAP